MDTEGRLAISFNVAMFSPSVLLVYHSFGLLVYFTKILKIN